MYRRYVVMGNLYSGIKRIDEAQRLELAAVLALQSTEDNGVAEFIDGAFRGMHFVQSKNWQDEHKKKPDESHT